MKGSLAFLTLIFFYIISCNKKSDIKGIWKVQSPHYNSTIEIADYDESLKAKVITYNDGTQKFNSSKNTEYFIYKNIIFKNNQFIDAVSGATKTNTNSTTFTLLHPDTLEITNYLHHKKHTEKWIKEK